MATGMVKWFNPDKDIGLIAPDGGGPDVAVHATALEKSGFEAAPEGNQKVSFDIIQGPNGPQAENITATWPAGTDICHSPAFAV